MWRPKPEPGAGREVSARGGLMARGERIGLQTASSLGCPGGTPPALPEPQRGEVTVRPAALGVQSSLQSGKGGCFPRGPQALGRGTDAAVGRSARLFPRPVAAPTAARGSRREAGTGGRLGNRSGGRGPLSSATWRCVAFASLRLSLGLRSLPCQMRLQIPCRAAAEHERNSACGQGQGGGRDRPFLGCRGPGNGC